MKKIFWTLVLLFNVYICEVSACDVCGCAAGGYYLGIMPQQNNHFIGLRYRNSTYDGHGGLVPYGAHDVFQSTELFTRYYLHPRVQLLGFVPYSFNHRLQTDREVQIQGLGDVLFLTNYQIWNTMRGNNLEGWRHSFFAGAGLKLPTGQFRFSDMDATQVNNANFQLGTGSLDYLLSSNYTLRWKGWGLNLEGSAKINGKNEDDYRFGTRFSGNGNLFLIRQLSESIGLMPYVGLYFEKSAVDRKQGVAVESTGGSLLASNAGIDIYFNQRWALGVKYQLPIYQNLGGGHLDAKRRWMLQLLVLW
jgi:hypothetical protein